MSGSCRESRCSKCPTRLYRSIGRFCSLGRGDLSWGLSVPHMKGILCTADEKPFHSSRSLAQIPLAEQNKLQDLLPMQHACKMRTQQFYVLVCCRTAVQSCLFPARSCPDSEPRQKALQTVSLGKRRTFNHRVWREQNQCKKDKLIENRVYKVQR